MTISSIDSNSRSIPRNLPCIGCGYNLRGLSTQATCPECGLVAARSADPTRLIHSDPQWLRGVVFGLDLCLIGLACGAVMFAALVTLTAWLRLETPMLQVVGWALAMPPGLVIVAGCWRITAPEPGVDPARSLRQAIRILVVILTALAILTLPAFIAAPPLSLLTWLLGCIVATAGGFAALAYAQRMTRRIPDRRLTRWTFALTILYMVLLAGLFAGIALGAVMNTLPMLPGPDGPDVFVIVVLIASVLGLLLELGLLGVAAIWTVAMLFWHRAALRRVLRQQAD